MLSKANPTNEILNFICLHIEWSFQTIDLNTMSKFEQIFINSFMDLKNINFDLITMVSKLLEIKELAYDYDIEWSPE